MTEGCRWLWVRIKALPGAAALHRQGTWSRTDEMLALLVERQDMWQSRHAVVWGAKPSRLPSLIEIRHPDRVVAERPRPTSDPDRIKQFIAKLGR